MDPVGFLRDRLVTYSVVKGQVQKLTFDSLVSSSRVVQQSSARVVRTVVAIMLECDSIGYLFSVPRYTLKIN